MWSLTIVCKATFDLMPGESPLAAEQDEPNDEDTHWDDDTTRSVSSPADLVPFKPRADVVLVGSAFAPQGQPVRTLVARLGIGAIDKAIEVHGHRNFGPDGLAREAAPFTKMRLRYERAAGGPETGNPVGVRVDGGAEGAGASAVPNLLPPGTSEVRRGDRVAPIGMGPLAASWPERRARLGRHAGTWPAPGWTERPVPDEIDPGFFNVAPRDQQIAAIRDDERIVLENLHPEHARLVTTLPGIRPRAVLERHGAAPSELHMTPDTLWIDTDRGVCTLTWRGQVRLADRAEQVRVTVTAERGAPRSGQHAPAVEEAGSPTMMLSPAMAGPAMPFGPGAAGGSPAMPFAPGAAGGGQAMPFAPGAAGGGNMPTMFLGPPPGADIEEVSVDEETSSGGEGNAVQTLLIGAAAVPVRAALPFAPSPQPQPAPAPLPVAPPPAVAPAPPPMVRAPTADPLSAPPSSPWGVAGGDPGRPLSIGQQAIAPAAAAVVRAPSFSAAGVLDISNAAAGPVAPPAAPPREAAPPPVAEPRPRTMPREVTKLLWFDPKGVARVRKHAEWRIVLAEQELRLLDAGEEDDDSAEATADAPSPRDRRDVFEVLTKARPIEADGVRVALDEAISDDGKFDPPLVLLAGELELPFDELETLKATAAALAPFAAGDPKLKEQLDAVGELLATPYLSGSAPMAEGMTQKLREAFGQGKRALPPGYIESNTERMLLEQRCYQHRTVFGKRWIRAVLRGGGMPVYVPVELKDELPMFRRFRMRLIGEVDLQEDQYEPAGCAVKVLALGRVLGGVG
jgi:hypothetical protein